MRSFSSVKSCPATGNAAVRLARWPDDNVMEMTGRSGSCDYSSRCLVSQSPVFTLLPVDRRDRQTPIRCGVPLMLRGQNRQKPSRTLLEKSCKVTDCTQGQLESDRLGLRKVF